MSDVRLPPSRIVIPSAAEGSLSFAVKRTMFGKLNRETFGHCPIYASRRFHIFMRRTTTPHSSLLTPN